MPSSSEASTGGAGSPGARAVAASVAAVVVTWNSASHIRACLQALDEQDHPDLHVIVVDNASRDGTCSILAELAATRRRHRLTVVRNPENLGFCGGVNTGLARLDDDDVAVLFVNPDVVAAPDVVSRCLAALAADPRRGSVQPRLHRSVRAADGTAVVDTTGHVFTTARLFHNRGEGACDQGQFATAGTVFGASGALVLHRRAMLDDIAWRHPDGRREVLTEQLFAYFDDVELDWRARLRGWTAWYEPAAVAIHERGGAGPRRTPQVEALNHTNRLLVVLTCDDVAALVRASPLVLVTSMLKFAELAVTTPRAVVPSLVRLRLVPGALRRRRQLLARASVAPAQVVRTHAQRFRWRQWVATWWRRVRGRAPGVARPVR